MRANIVFNRAGQLNKHGEAPLTIVIYLITRERVYFNIPSVTVSKENWDEKKCRVSRKDTDHARKNVIIEREWSRVAKYLGMAEVLGKELKIQEVRGFFNDEPEIATFNDYIKKNLSKSRTKVSLSMDTIYSRQNTLDLFNTYKPKAFLHEFDNKVIEGFVDWLHKKGDADNTIAKHMKNLRTFVTLAQYDGLVKEGRRDDPFRSITIKRVRSEKKYSLTFKDIELIKKCDFTTDDGTAYHSWKMFLFACRTAFRISDVFDLRYKHVNLTENGWVIVKKSVKANGGTYRNNLSQIKDIFGDNIAEEVLLEYYKDEHGEEDLIFPTFSEESVKKGLDKIQSQTDIPKNITFHIARHTCATHLAAKDVGLHKIMRIGGWNDPRTIKVYIDLADDLLGRY